MSFHAAADLRWYQFDIFPQGMTQAIFTRKGGVSPAPWDTLNVGGTVGDEAERVLENRMRSFRSAGRRLESMYDVWQVHSADHVIAQAARQPEDGYRKADIILTDRPEVTLYMRFADCVPVLLHDPVRRAVGMVHAGWLGTVRGASGSAIKAMVDAFGSQPEDILAGIGPSIGPDHYEVKADVVAQVSGAFGANAGNLVEVRGGKSYLDLWAANRLQMEALGVRNIEVCGLCTACHTDDWYSHRAEHGRTGRFGAMIALHV